MRAVAGRSFRSQCIIYFIFIHVGFISGLGAAVATIKGMLAAVGKGMPSQCIVGKIINA
jgi:hypothetical protein